MRSQLWQRLRAARRFSGKRQQDIANVVKISRGAIAQWESHDEGIRTHPSLEQIKLVARETGVPLDWLMDDTANPEDVWRLESRTPAPVAAPTPALPEDRMTEAFTRAVEFAVMERDASILDGFGTQAGEGALLVRPGFHRGQDLVGFCSTLAGQREALGQLLLSERVIGRPLNKHLLVLDRTGTPGTAAMDVRVFFVASPQEAAEYLLNL